LGLRQFSFVGRQPGALCRRFEVVFWGVRQFSYVGGRSGALCRQSEVGFFGSQATFLRRGLTWGTVQAVRGGFLGS
jgi:hypothetical protein